MTLEQQRPSLEYLVRESGKVESEKFPDIEVVKFHFRQATGRTAIQAFLDIRDFTGGKEELVDLPKEEKAKRTLILDNNAERASTLTISGFPFRVNILNAEGLKEKYSYVGQQANTSTGEFGSGDEETDAALDYTEQSTNGVHGRKGTTSMAGVTDPGGLTKIPEIYGPGGELEEASYFMKLFGPKELRSALSQSKSAKENFQTVMKQAIIPASQITVAVMDRKANTSILRDAEEVGVNLQFIKSGDLDWCIQAINSSPESPIIMMGRGGAPEGQIAAIGARAMGAVGDVRVYEQNGVDEELDHKTPVWSAEEFVPGLPEHSIIIFSSIMPSSTFDMDPVIPHSSNPNKFTVSTRYVTQKGLSGIIKETLDYQRVA